MLTDKTWLNGDNILLESGSRGNDIVLTLDINLQQEVEKILEQQLVKAKREANTEYYNKSFVVYSKLFFISLFFIVVGCIKLFSAAVKYVVSAVKLSIFFLSLYNYTTEKTFNQIVSKWKVNPETKICER